MEPMFDGRMIIESEYSDKTISDIWHSVCLMTDRYHQFKILYSLYEKLHNGTTGFINKAIIINEEELRYIPKDTINADLIRLEDNSLIKVNRGQNIESLKISGKGIEIIEF